MTAGPVFCEGPGALTRIRESLAWYPDDVWRYAVAADWSRLRQEFPDVGRAGLRGDEDGSAVIAARHVRTLLHLAHLLPRCWPRTGSGSRTPRPVCRAARRCASPCRRCCGRRSGGRARARWPTPSNSSLWSRASRVCPL
ncbi:DUF4037 domain-containing protein [Brachybacterium alimentarium]|uniref:DUF4037 domain-containing protein n=1 Tax=Brachybacterium alimentarium TaxID=47845 RepID=UPI002163DE65|nr:DUF4037 domain-containing protein [Brachybacterium alimentarium]